MEGRLMAHRVMAVKPSMKRRRADQEDHDQNSHWKKRMIERADDDETWEKDENLKIGCRQILNDLIARSRIWEVKIRRDLAAVEGKLEKNIYSDAKEFVDDVRLVLKNAKPYSPRWAAELEANFMRQWKLLEAKITKKDIDHVHVVGTCNGQDSKDDDSTSSSSSCVVDVVSPEKALRAAMLKTRFADTINKATQTLFPDKKFSLPRQEKNWLKIRRQRERRALEEIEKRVDLDNTVATLQMWFGPTWYGGSPHS